MFNIPCPRSKLRNSAPPDLNPTLANPAGQPGTTLVVVKTIARVELADGASARSKHVRFVALQFAAASVERRITAAPSNTNTTPLHPSGSGHSQPRCFLPQIGYDAPCIVWSLSPRPEQCRPLYGYSRPLFVYSRLLGRMPASCRIVGRRSR